MLPVLLLVTWAALVPPTLSLPHQIILENSPEDIQGHGDHDYWDVPGWLDPKVNGGQMIDFTTKRRGEPLNVIISGKSHPEVLTHEGFKKYAITIGFAGECFGLHYGAVHRADLGDGLGKRDEMYLGRQYYFHPVYGTCWESIVGGNHFRAWKQNGTDAWFLAVSTQRSILKHHEITTDGYNIGRNLLVEQAVAGNGRWKAHVEWVDGLLEFGKQGINHGIAQDGRVAVLTVHLNDS